MLTISRVRCENDVLILSLDGGITIGENAYDFRSAIMAAIEDGHKKVALNMAAVPLIDSSGLAELCSLNFRLRGLGGGLKLFSLTEKTKDLFRLTKLSIEFELFQTLDSALSSFAVA